MSSTLLSSPETETPDTPRPIERSDKIGKRWAKRAGAGVFLFFLIKGLLWLIVPPALILGARFFAQ